MAIAEIYLTDGGKIRVDTEDVPLEEVRNLLAQAAQGGAAWGPIANTAHWTVIPAKSIKYIVLLDGRVDEI